MPGLVKAHPIFCGFWLLFCTLFGAVMANQEMDLPSNLANVLGVAIGAAVWWAFMLCFSRGWIKEGD